MKKIIAAGLVSLTMLAATPAFAQQTFSSVADRYETIINNFVSQKLPIILQKFDLLDPNFIAKVMPMLGQAQQDNSAIATSLNGVSTGPAQSLLDMLEHYLGLDSTASTSKP